MKTKRKSKPRPTVEPLPPATPREPFPPSAELGEALRRAEQEQTEIDRRQAEELARLRAVQDRD